MGLGASAELIWGIPVLAYDEDGEPTPFWDEDADDWREFEGEIEVYPYGHYEDPDGPRGILTSSRVEHYSGDCWTPKPVDVGALAAVATYDKVYSKSEDQARSAGLPVSFYADARWCLVANFG